MIPLTNLTGSGKQTNTFKELACYPSLVSGLRQQFISLSTVNILLSITAFLGNSLILVVLRKESFLHPPSKLLYRCLATTDLLVGLVSQPLAATHWMSVAHEQWNFCRYASEASFITSYALCLVSLLTMTAISADRLLALLLGVRYKHIVTLKRIYSILAAFWVLSSVTALCYILDYRITIWCGRVVGLSCIIVSIVWYGKIFSLFNHHQAQVQDHVQQQPSKPNAPNLARYRKAVCSALWVQLALIVCSAPINLVEIVIAHSKQYPPHLVVIRQIASCLVFFNSTLNPFLYCWKISEVRQAAKQTIGIAIDR